MQSELAGARRSWGQSLARPWPRAGIFWTPGRTLLLLAGIAVAVLILLVPAYLLLRMAGAEAGLRETLVQANTWGTLLNTVRLATAVTLASMLLALPIAWLTVRSDLPGKRAWAILAALPLVFPSYVAAYIFMTLLAPKGLLQQALEPLLGIQRMPSLIGFPGAFLVLTLVSYPLVLLPVRAALQRLDPSLVEAARSLGLSSWQANWRVVLPQLRPSLAAGGLLVTLYVLRDFGAVTMWQYSTFTRLIYNRYLSYKLDAAAALAIVLVVLTVVVVLLEARARGKARYARLSAGSARRAEPVALGHWRWPALLFLGAVIFAGLVLPAATLVVWIVRGWQDSWAGTGIESWMPVLEPAWNSLSVSVLAAVLVTLAALPVAVLAVRRPGRLSGILERITYTSYALPGIVVALALVFFGIRYAEALYQTLPLLLAAYVILFVPQALGAQRASLLQITPSLEEAGRSLGQRPWDVFRRITLPLLRPGLLAGAALVFLTTMKELPAALILSPLGYTTLATQIWSTINEAFFARAAVPALLLLLLSSLPLAYITWREHAAE